MACRSDLVAKRMAGASDDLTVEQVAEELGRSGSTVRGWLAAAEFPNAFKLNRREWRIPISDVRTLLDRQRPQATSRPEAPRVQIYEDTG
ncbi:MAG: helix-turn-helix domain-containing protein [Gemmatimonas sp.]|nr:helix-turn-helix domain-containing protein [Gemmatimonas sp.]